MKKILLYNSGGGLGDSIQLFTLILSLQKHFKSSEFFYLGAHENHFQGKLKEFNINIKTLDLGLKYFGFRWWHFLVAKKRFIDLEAKKRKEKFVPKKRSTEQKLDKIDLIIDLQSKLRNTIILNRIPHDHFYSPTYGFKFCTKKAEYSSENHLENLSNFLNTNIKISKFSLNNLEEKYKSEAKRLFPELHSNIACPALVTALASRLNLAISIDNGVMHMMGLANIPMIVLFGPTDSEKFAPKINSIQILDSKKMYKSKDINRITVHDVFKLI